MWLILLDFLVHYQIGHVALTIVITLPTITIGKLIAIALKSEKEQQLYISVAIVGRALRVYMAMGTKVQ